MQLLPGIVGLIAGVEPIDADVLSRSELKVISRCGTGLSNVDLEAAKKLGIAVCNTPDAPTQAVAELTVACMLNSLRKIPQMNQEMQEGHWNKQSGFQLQGKTVVIVGLGRIGRRVAQLLKPFHVRLIGVDPFLSGAEEGIELLTLEEALPWADIITLHSNGKDCLLSDREFALMKKGVFLLNSARGTLIDEEALIKAVKEARLGGVWLDTFNQEPYSGELTKFSCVTLTPHIGSYTLECRKAMELEAVENLISTFEKMESNVYR